MSAYTTVPTATVPSTGTYAPTTAPIATSQYVQRAPVQAYPTQYQPQTSYYHPHTQPQYVVRETPQPQPTYYTPQPTSQYIYTQPTTQTQYVQPLSQQVQEVVVVNPSPN